MTFDLTPADLATYSAHQVASLADVDHAAVLAEGFRRQAAAEKELAAAERKLAKALAAVEAAKAGVSLAGIIIKAAHAEQSREAERFAAERATAGELFSQACHGAGAEPRKAARAALENMARETGRESAAVLLEIHGFDLGAYHAAAPISC